MSLVSATLGVANRIARGALSRWRNLYYRALGVRMGGYVWMQAIEVPRQHEAIEIGAACALDRGVVLLCSGPPAAKPKIRIGESTYVNRATFVDAVESVEIGPHCAIGPGCYITDHDHGMDPRLPPLGQPTIAKPTAIADHVWIGAHVSILKGVSIGSHAVIGAGSVVTRDIPANAVAAGNPAVVLRSLQGAAAPAAAECPAAS